jgi:hypothetical protein
MIVMLPVLLRGGEGSGRGCGAASRTTAAASRALGAASRAPAGTIRAIGSYLRAQYDPGGQGTRARRER